MPTRAELALMLFKAYTDSEQEQREEMKQKLRHRKSIRKGGGAAAKRKNSTGVKNETGVDELEAAAGDA